MLSLALMVLAFYFEIIQIYRNVARMVKHPISSSVNCPIVNFFFVFVPSFLQDIYVCVCVPPYT